MASSYKISVTLTNIPEAAGHEGFLSLTETGRNVEKEVEASTREVVLPEI